MANMIAIVGRPNVGKSTLFNRLTESRMAIVEESPGVTRDRHYGKANWNGFEFSVIDTGGYVRGSEDNFEGEIRRQVELAIDEANIILFVVDVTIGITHLDEAVADLLRKSKKQVFVVSNKVDNNERISLSSEFYSLGLGEIFSISAINGSGTGELLDELVKHLDKEKLPEENDLPKLAIVGRPNVGKSSLLNALLGVERSIVTDIAGTTRDAIDTHYNMFGKDFILVDTAGIRKKAKVHEDIEFYSVMRSVKVIEECNVCLLMIDARVGIEAQEMSIFRLIEKNRKGVVLVVNKWDLVDSKHSKSTKEYEEYIKKKITPFIDVPVVFTSATTKQRILKAVEVALQVNENRQRKIPTSKINDVMQMEIENHPPPAIKGKYIKIKYAQQLHTFAPSFAFFCNLPQYVNEPYKRYLENKIREHFEFSGVPIQVFMRKK